MSGVNTGEVPGVLRGATSRGSEAVSLQDAEEGKARWLAKIRSTFVQLYVDSPREPRQSTPVSVLMPTIAGLFGWAESLRPLVTRGISTFLAKSSGYNRERASAIENAKHEPIKASIRSSKVTDCLCTSVKSNRTLSRLEKKKALTSHLQLAKRLKRRARRA